MTTQTVLVPLAEGFEEIEAVTIIDVLRRADLAVKTCYLRDPDVTGAHRLTVKADQSLDSVDASRCAMVVLPGGMPGSSNLAEDRRVLDLVRSVDRSGGYVAAICAAPMVLAAAGVLGGKRATCYPGFETKLEGASVSKDKVVVDGKLVTGNGPGSAVPFALKLVELLRGKVVADELAKGLLWT
ncbi:MAG: DJ-1/PfpI family protein [Deltaproteobacteria bacterium]|nr:DJ-1/PfpI family protein [Deltaproteobacteria bacterium]